MDPLSSLPERPGQKTQEEEAIMSQFFGEPQQNQRPPQHPNAPPQHPGVHPAAPSPQGYPPQHPNAPPQYPNGPPQYPGNMQGHPGMMDQNTQQEEYVQVPSQKSGGVWKVVGAAILLFALMANSYTGGMLSKLPKLNESNMMTFSVQIVVFAILLAIAAYFLTK